MAYASRLDLTSFTTRRWLQVFPAHKANHESSPDFDLYYSDSTKGDKIIWPKNHTRETFSLFRQIENSSFPVCVPFEAESPPTKPVFRSFFRFLLFCLIYRLTSIFAFNLEHTKKPPPPCIKPVVCFFWAELFVCVLKQKKLGIVSFRPSVRDNSCTFFSPLGSLSRIFFFFFLN